MNKEDNVELKKYFAFVCLACIFACFILGVMLINAHVTPKMRLEMGVQQYLAEHYPGQPGTIHCRESTVSDQHECKIVFDDARIILVHCEGNMCFSPKLPFYMEKG
jgi:hypothetical protein